MAKAQTVISRDYTINLHKRLYKVQAKKRAPRAIKEIKAFAQMHAQTKDVRIDSGLNKALWKQGVNHVPTRLRLRISRLRNEKEDAEEQFYTVVSHVEVPRDQLRHLTTSIVESEDA